MAGPEQHQLLRLKQLKFLHCSFCLALPLEADVPGAPWLELPCLVRAKAWATCCGAPYVPCL